MKRTKNMIALALSMSFLFIGCAPKDSDVQAKINEKFEAAPELRGATATVNDGVATLTGEVQDESAKSMAAAEAEKVKGVKSVVNNLTTPPPPPPPTVNSDSALTQGVMDATKDFPGVTATVNNGEITLTGTIKRDDLTRLMQSINSLNPAKVNNQLKVE